MLVAVRRDKDRLSARVQILDPDLAAARRAMGGRPGGQTADGEPESPAAERGVGAPYPAACSLLVGRVAGMACAG